MYQPSASSQLPSTGSSSSAGFAVVESEWTTALPPAAQTALQGLLTEYGVVRSPRKRQRHPSRRRHHRRMVIPDDTETLKDVEILELARKGDIALLASLLRVVETTTTTTMRQWIKATALAVVPQSTPGCCDARDMVQAAAVFLCTKGYVQGTDEPLEKRSFTKVGDWELDDIMDELTELEDEFYKDDPRQYEWLARERFVPTEAHVDPASLEQLLMKGTKAPSKKKTPAPANRKKPKPAPEKIEEVTVEVIRDTTGSDGS